MKIALGLLLAVPLLAQNATDTPEAHVAIAKAAAGEEYTNLFNFVCPPPAAPRGGGGGQGAAAAAPRGQGGGQGGGQRGAAASPDRSTWHAEPVKVFDNLYWFGQTEYSVWALTTSDGIIVFDAIFDYSIEDEVDAGMKKLGLDPAKIKYAVISHSHPDHFGGGKFLQDKYGTKVFMSAEDWDVLEKMSANVTRPKRDLVATDGQKFTLGDTTVTMYFTPGHTPGTISSVFQVKDNGKTHTVALWGGMGLNNDRATLTQYIASAKKFEDVARQAGADIILSNHTDWDRSKINLPMLAKGPMTPNPYVTNNASVLRYLKTAEECATAKVMRLN
ncbi:MAG TPA: MBL fold metallo-hydrolase [Terriglobia bacterium]|nr:MBL fold metallo-hydrolase [Terriglobia bacterium]